MKGDFLGFSFNGRHSSEFNIIRVSDGSRYQDGLVPEMEDMTNNVPGRDGAYFYGSVYKERTFSIKFAFDNVTDDNLRDMRQWLGYDGIASLIYDEFPYKKYMVKITSLPNLDYVCFDERKRRASNTSRDGARVENRSKSGDETVVNREQVYPWEYELDGNGEYVKERIYKGEGTIDFIAYYPFALSTGHTIEDVVANVDGAGANDEWKNGSHVPTKALYESYNIDKVIKGNDEGDVRIPVYNFGDKPTPFKLTIEVSSDDYYLITDYRTQKKIYLNFNGITLEDTQVIVDSYSRLIIGVQTNQIYNKAIVAGDFFEISPSSSITTDTILINTNHPLTTVAQSTNNEYVTNISIDYDCLFF